MQSKKINETKYASSLNWYYPPIVNDGIEFTENSEALFYTGKVKKANIIAGSNTKERAYFEKTAIEIVTYYDSKEVDDLNNHLLLFQLNYFRISNQMKIAFNHIIFTYSL